MRYPETWGVDRVNRLLNKELNSEFLVAYTDRITSDECHSAYNLKLYEHIPKQNSVNKFKFVNNY